MEIKLDIGQNTHNILTKIAKEKSKEVENFALDMIEFGLRVYQSSQKSDSPDEQLKYVMENNKILKEIIRCVFDKTKTTGKLFDAETLITMIENNVGNYLKGKSE